MADDVREITGERYSGVIVLRNDSAEPQEAKVYQTDYESHADGNTIEVEERYRLPSRIGVAGTSQHAGGWTA